MNRTVPLLLSLLRFRVPIFVTSTVMIEPRFVPPTASANGSPSSALIESEIRSFSTSTSATLAFTMSPLRKSPMTSSPRPSHVRSDRCVLNFTFNFCALWELLSKDFPWVAHCLLKTKRNATLGAVDFQNHDFDFL